jgi:hypothetical protein
MNFHEQTNSGVIARTGSSEINSDQRRTKVAALKMTDSILNGMRIKNTERAMVQVREENATGSGYLSALWWILMEQALTHCVTFTFLISIDSKGEAL